MIQLIVYSAATGRVRRVIDPQVNVPNVIAFLAQAKAMTGEAVLVYTKQGNGQDTLPAWQAAVTAHTNLTPANDQYCIVDSTNKVIGVVLADPACADAVPNCSLIQNNTAGPGWTYVDGVFTP